MHTAVFRAAAVVALAALPLAASAASKPFPAIAGWDHTSAAATTPGRLSETYRKDDQVVTVLADDGLKYDDMVGAIKKNVSDNAMKPSVDRDLQCGGKRAHEIELTLGTTVYHQLIVDDNPGVTKVTYTRMQSSPAATDASAALTGYCGS